MGPQGSGASQHGFAAFKCALALHILAKLHELLTQCALAELQNSGHCTAWCKCCCWRLSESGEACQGWHDLLCVFTVNQALSLRHMNAILACDTAGLVRACSACNALQLDTLSFSFRKD